MYETPLEITFSCHLPSSSRSTAEIAHSSGFIVLERDLKIFSICTAKFIATACDCHL
eukprot:07286.XXX_264530_264700_1 [CDS] Oithona nana genome sequencing.